MKTVDIKKDPKWYFLREERVKRWALLGGLGLFMVGFAVFVGVMPAKNYGGGLANLARIGDALMLLLLLWVFSITTTVCWIMLVVTKRSDIEEKYRKKKRVTITIAALIALSPLLLVLWNIALIYFSGNNY